VVRKVLRNSTSGSALLLRDLMYDSNGNVKPTRLSALLNAALGYVADQTQGFIDFDAVPEDGASIQVSAQLISRSIVLLCSAVSLSASCMQCAFCINALVGFSVLLSRCKRHVGKDAASGCSCCTAVCCSMLAVQTSVVCAGSFLSGVEGSACDIADLSSHACAHATMHVAASRDCSAFHLLPLT